MVQSKLDSSQVWYIEIQEKSHSRSELLQQALCNAKIFGEDEVELMNWLSEVHDKLRRLSVQDSSPEGLWTQQAELRVFWFILLFHFSWPYFLSSLYFCIILCSLWFRLIPVLKKDIAFVYNDLFLNWSLVDLQCGVSFMCTVNQFSYIYVYIYIYFFRFFSHLDYYTILSIVPCAIQ